MTEEWDFFAAEEWKLFEFLCEKLGKELEDPEFQEGYFNMSLVNDIRDNPNISILNINDLHYMATRKESFLNKYPNVKKLIMEWRMLMLLRELLLL